ncbi:hypothetical protein SAMN05892883_2105 [Jatrophihabitans sp. GAS493]|uniref:hypothetical protein n=1 Tax=Jatrophihabitans sp. GAS493 TaxID=1907575 RepID=UPI000BB7F38E|nr:hypothetical protein [Jatrophihabitans sp. GAS493]SOD72762.1 hypothetical protein SAMN05892883_2105 [Jatrophihabitans sp. GAS493]
MSAHITDAQLLALVKHSIRSHTDPKVHAQFNALAGHVDVFAQAELLRADCTRPPHCVFVELRNGSTETNPNRVAAKVLAERINANDRGSLAALQLAQGLKAAGVHLPVWNLPTKDQLS